MSGTGHDPAESWIPSEPITGHHNPAAPGHEMGPAEVAEELLDTAEHLVGDRVAAWAAIRAELERRIAHLEGVVGACGDECARA